MGKSRAILIEPAFDACGGFFPALRQRHAQLVQAHGYRLLVPALDKTRLLQLVQELEPVGR